MRTAEHWWHYICRLGGDGILSRQDVADLRNQRARVLYLMLDCEWHTANEVIAAAGGREGLRRMRELREIPYVEIDRQRIAGHRDFRYRLTYAPGTQQELF